MLESLRGLGYSTATALADIIDNSISAGASEVRVDFHWEQAASSISILDDGRGMDDSELEAAMRLGAINPLSARAASDLGRFGMGLKTASFSQCRRLTVASTKVGATSCLRWDLTELAANPESDWLLFEGPAPGSEPSLARLDGKASGTLVLWEDLDRIVSAGSTADDFLDVVDAVETHLAMVFHRLIQGPQPRLRLLLNGRLVRAWDPFMTGHPAKPWSSPVARHVETYGAVEVQCHVLPHKDKLSDEDFLGSAGPLGWTAQQGFYVYRNERLLVSGGWLGLGYPRAWNREEAHRLARTSSGFAHSRRGCMFEVDQAHSARPWGMRTHRCGHVDALARSTLKRSPVTEAIMVRLPPHRSAQHPGLRGRSRAVTAWLPGRRYVQLHIWRI